MDAEGSLLDDRYEVGARLGRGGTAVVHRAWDRERGREVAVKLLPPTEVRPGRRESDILAALDHPRLVALHDVLRTEDGTALVMELVDGPSLHDRLQDGPLDPDEVATVLADVAAGLAHAHRRGVVHRDVKPGNVLLRVERGRVTLAKLSDFGIARRVDATRTTGERSIVGTVRFLSPEQVRGERATAASDVYSLGLTALAALTGAEAFPGTETETLAARLVRAPELPADLPGDWAELLRAMTALDPAGRVDASGASALAAALASGHRPAVAAAAPSTPTTRPIDVLPAAAVQRPVRRRRRRMAAAIAGMAVAGALLGGGVAAVFAPTAVQEALGGVVPAPPAATSPPRATAAPVASAPPVAASTGPTLAAKEPAAPPIVTDDHGGGHHGGDDQGGDHRGRGRGGSGRG